MRNCTEPTPSCKERWKKTLASEPIYRACWKARPAEYWSSMPIRKHKSSIPRLGVFWPYRPIGCPAREIRYQRHFKSNLRKFQRIVSFRNRNGSLPKLQLIVLSAFLCANVSEVIDGQGDSIWIIRDITEQERLASERESARSSRALAEVVAVLAHEIRNPLGSMELFAGLLADATAQMPETRQWVTHLQAGLRTLSSTKQ